MPKLLLSVPHELGEQRAVERLVAFVDRARAEYGQQVSGLEAAWSGNALAFQFFVLGQRVHGAMTVAATEVCVESALPLAATMFRGSIERSIRDELARVLT